MCYTVSQTVAKGKGYFLTQLRPAIRALAGSRIAEIPDLGIGDPEIIPLWYGEGDLPTPASINAAANAALAAGQTF